MGPAWAQSLGLGLALVSLAFKILSQAQIEGLPKPGAWLGLKPDGEVAGLSQKALSSEMASMTW